MELILLIICVFAVYRLSLLLTFETGPFSLAEIIRWNLAETFKDTWIEEGVNCPLCVGFWLSFIFAIPFWDGPLTYLVYALGIAGAQTFLTMIGGVPSKEEEETDDDVDDEGWMMSEGPGIAIVNAKALERLHPEGKEGNGNS
jgi:hypothetical protein